MTKASESSRSRRAICRRSERRAASSAASVVAGDVIEPEPRFDTTEDDAAPAAETVETIGGDESEEDDEDEDEAEAQIRRTRSLRHYKIQEVIKRRQIMLVQVTKEERGNKGAALTTYLSLAGRYCVLMPNTDRGGGISRKITTATDRKKLRTIVQSLAVPKGMGLIVRTAGAKRTKAEIKRDYDYLVRAWEVIRDTTLHSIAPALIYEEEDLVKRAIRDLYDKELEGIWVEGEYASAINTWSTDVEPTYNSYFPVDSASPASVNFGNQAVFSLAVNQVVTFTNTGNAALITSSPYISGDSDFLITFNGCYFITLQPGGSCQEWVSFFPSNVGAGSGFIAVPDNTAFGVGYSPLSGTGVKAGPGVRDVLEVCGIRNILTKVHGSSNPINLVKATIQGLLQLRTREEVARLRGVTL